MPRGEAVQTASIEGPSLAWSGRIEVASTAWSEAEAAWSDPCAGAAWSDRYAEGGGSEPFAGISSSEQCAEVGEPGPYVEAEVVSVLEAEGLIAGASVDLA